MLPSYDFVWILMKSFIQISTTNVNEQFRTWTNIQRLFRPLSELERSWASLSERNIRLLSIFKKDERPWAISVLIPVLIPARKQRSAPYDVNKVYFFVVQCRISSATKTSVNGPSRLTSEAVIKRSISYKLSVTSYKKPKYRIQIIINYKLQITNYKIQIKPNVINDDLQIGIATVAAYRPGNLFHVFKNCFPGNLNISCL